MIPEMCSRCGHGRATHWGGEDSEECVVCRRCPSFRPSWLARMVARWLLRGTRRPSGVQAAGGFGASGG